MGKGACNSVYYQYYGRNSSNITMHIIGCIILTRNMDVQSGPPFYHAVMPVLLFFHCEFNKVTFIVLGGYICSLVTKLHAPFD